MKAGLLTLLLVSVLEPLDAERTPMCSLSITFAAYSSDSSVSVGGTSSIQIDELWISMQDARVRPATACKRDAARAIVAGGFSVELVRSTTTAPAPAQLQVDRYCAFEVQLRRLRGKLDGVPSELRGASIVVRGHRADGTPFVLQSRFSPSLLLRARAMEGFSAAAPNTNWMIGVDVARWFAGVDVNAGEVSGDIRDRVLRVDDKSNPDLLAAFNANVEKGFALFEDANRNRTLDPEEQQKPIATQH
jgi:hypothetical protein